MKNQLINDISNINNEKFIQQLINLLDKSVVEQVKQSQEYLLELNTFIHLINFLLGENIDIRRWNPGQAKEFSIIHETIQY